MDYLRGLAVIWCLCLYALPIMTVICIWEEIDKRREKKYNRLIAQRRKAFADDVQRCGRRMLDTDRRCETVNKAFEKKQTIKYTGLFSGEEVERILRNEVH